MGVPRALILRLNRDIHQVLADADTRTQLLSRGLEPAATTPDEFARHIRSEIERWSKVIRESGYARRSASDPACLSVAAD